ncbi:MAG: ComF family protein [Rhodospirillaceae bacterium]|nr:ComF family protein [Rhodospirillaceae bacterium]
MLDKGDIWRSAKLINRLVLDSLLPPRCLSCNAIVDSTGSLCSACFARFTFITSPSCMCYGIPLESPVVEDLICGMCLKDRPAFERTQAAFIYDANSQTLVLKLKHADRTDAAVHLARWLQRAGAELIAHCDVVVPVPLHRWQFFMRTYNQAALLANALGRLADKPVVPDALKRTRSTPSPSQGHLDRTARRRNVARAFAAHRPEAITGRRVLLIDDVLTTGAAADACARALLDAGATVVDVLVLARVPSPGAVFT